MEREKMIETILRYMCPFFSDGICRGEIRCHDDCIKKSFAKDAVNELIPEEAVVLTREEYERLKALPEKVHDEMEERMKEEIAIEKRMGEDKLERFENNMKNVLEIEKENIRKETVREILRKAEKKARFVDGGNYSKDRYELNLDDLKMIIKKDFGVEVEE